MKKLFETNVKQNADALPRTVDADIDSTGVPYIMYKQFQLDDNFKTLLEGTMQSEHMLRTETKPTPYQNLVELVSGTESRVVDFTEANKQLTFFAISLVYDKSDQHRSIYGRYNAELAITKCLSKVPLTQTVHLIVGNSILATRTTNCYCIVSLWRGPAKHVALLRYLVMQIILCFKNYLLEANILRLPTRKYLSI